MVLSRLKAGLPLVIALAALAGCGKHDDDSSTQPPAPVASSPSPAAPAPAATAPMPGTSATAATPAYPQSSPAPATTTH